MDRAERGIRADEGHDDRPLRFAGGLAIAGAALWVLSLSQAFAEGGPSQVSIPEFRSYVLILAALASGAGTCMLLPRIQRVIGPGILLGTVAAANYALLSEAVSFVYATREDWMGTGLLLNLIAGVTLAIAACLAAVTLVRTHDVHIVSRPPADTLAWLVVLLGAVGAIAFFGHFQQDSARAAIDTSRWFLIPRVWVTAMALVVPASAAVAAPRRFAAALLAGWIGGGAALFFVRLRIPDPWIVVFACTLVALLLILIPFARAAPTAQAKGTPEEVDQ